MTLIIRLIVSFLIIAGIIVIYLATHDKAFQLNYFNWTFNETHFQETTKLTDGWQFYQFPRNEFKVGLSNSEVNSGRQSAYIINRVPTQDGIGFIHQYLNALPFRGKQLKFSAYFKTYKVMERAYISVTAFDENGTELAFNDTKHNYLNEDNDWVLVNTTIDVPENTSYLMYGAKLKGQGQVWVDDFSFKEIDFAGESTIYAHDHRPYEPPYSEERQRYLNKIGFRLNTDSNLSTHKLKQQLDTWYVSDEVRALYAVSQDYEQPFADLPSIQIASIHPDADFGVVMQRVKVDKIHDVGLKFSAHVKSNFVKGGASLWLRIEDEKGLAIEFDNLMGHSQFGSNNWQTMHVTLPMPERAKYVSFGALLISKGQLWFAQPKLEFVSYVPPKEKPKLLLQPTNLSFE